MGWCGDGSLNKSEEQGRQSFCEQVGTIDETPSNEIQNITEILYANCMQGKRKESRNKS
jgi:hypothetical protein